MQKQKKPSLFKQRIKQQNVKIVDGFPEVPQIPLEPLPTAMEIEKESKPNKRKTLLESMKEKALVNDKQFDEINKQNEEFLSKLTPEQIVEMQKQLQQELPMTFMDRMKKVIEGSAPPNSKGMAEIMEEQTTITNSKPPEQIHRSPQQLQAKAILCQRLDKLCIQPNSRMLAYKDETSPQDMVNLHLIRLMLQSTNNQSMTTGLSVLSQLMLALSKSPFSYGVAILGGYYWDYMVLMDHIWQSLLYPILQLFQSNRFKTWRVQCVQTILIYVSLGGRISQQHYQMIMEQAQKHKDAADLSSYLQASKKPLKFVSLWQKLLAEGSMQTMKQLLLIVNNPTIIIEKLTAENVFYGESKQHKGEMGRMAYYYQQLRAKCGSDIQSHQQQLANSINLLYRIVEVSVMKKKMAKDPIVKSLLKSIGKHFQKYLLWIIPTTKTSIDLYRLLFVMRWCDKQRFVQFTQCVHQYGWNGVSRVEPIITLLNLSLYLKQEWSAGEINLVQAMLSTIVQWVDTKPTYINMQLILLQLVKIFRNQQDSYQQLNQQLLDVAFFKVIKQCNIEVLVKLLNQNIDKVKLLVNSYIYNSFGNIPFTKLMLFIGSTLFSQPIQLLITGECIQRYPFIFLQAANSDLYGQTTIPDLYKFSCRPQKLKQELESVRKMLMEGGQTSCKLMRLLK